MRPTSRVSLVLLAAVVGSLATACSQGAAAPEPTAAAAPSGGITLLRAARIDTVDATAPVAQAMAWDADGRIVAVGATADLAKRFPDAKTLDFSDATIVPGLIDAHGHLPNLGLFLDRADLTGTTSKADVIARLQAFAKGLKPGEWLLGRGWDQNDWPEQVFPTAADLDAVFTDRPVWVERIDGHAYWANSLAMQRSSRDLKGNWQPNGGHIQRAADGTATGIFVDDPAIELIEKQVPALDDAQTERMLQRAVENAASNGLTGVHDAGVTLQQLQAFQRLADRHALPLRVTAMADGDKEALAWLCKNGAYTHPGGRLQMRTVKLYADGALGSRGAALLAPYSDDPGNTGLLVTDPGALEKTAARAKGCGLQVATHAIGDRGNRIVLDIYERVLGADAKTDHRWRVEHAQLLSPQDIPRFGQLGVIASMQPTHATSDMPWAEQRVGPERIAGAYAWRQVLNSGGRLALGSDFPVESVDPRLGLASAVTRADAKGQPPGGWRPQEKLTRAEALRGFTLDAAYAGFAEKDVGSLAVGKRADFVVLGADPLDEKTDLRAMPVRATYLDGVEAWRAR